MEQLLPVNISTWSGYVRNYLCFQNNAVSLICKKLIVPVLTWLASSCHNLFQAQKYDILSVHVPFIYASRDN